MCVEQQAHMQSFQFVCVCVSEIVMGKIKEKFRWGQFYWFFPLFWNFFQKKKTKIKMNFTLKTNSTRSHLRMWRRKRRRRGNLMLTRVVLYFMNWQQIPAQEVPQNLSLLLSNPGSAQQAILWIIFTGNFLTFFFPSSWRKRLRNFFINFMPFVCFNGAASHPQTLSNDGKLFFRFYATNTNALERKKKIHPLFDSNFIYFHILLMIA